MIYAIVLLLLVALFCFRRSATERAQAGLPGGQVVYSDTSRWLPLEQPLYDPLAGLTGKPDYLIKQAGRGAKSQVIPVEVKTGRTPEAPYDSHIFQLAAYCLLVESHFGARPAHGLIKYPQRTFVIEYTPQLERSLRELLEEIRRHNRQRQVDRSHENSARCRACGFRPVCDQAL